MGNRLLFPANASSYVAADIHGLFWVPTSLSSAAGYKVSFDELRALYNDGGQVADWIPCQYLRPTTRMGENQLILYMHGNSCDIGDMTEEMKVLQANTGRHIVQFEYPGYGICGASHLADPDTINDWAIAVAVFLLSLDLPPSNLVIMGRSIGTGPAAKLARRLVDAFGDIGGLILHSPYISIHALVMDYAWRPATLLISNHWDTEAELKTLARKNVSLLVVHGMCDEVIPIRHGKELYDRYSCRRKMANFPSNSEHNSYYVVEDLADPINQFLIDYGRYDLRVPVPLIPAWCYDKPKRAATLRSRGVVAPRLTVDEPNRGDGTPSTNALTRVLFCGCSSPASPEK